jgi:hypothetical protein
MPNNNNNTCNNIHCQETTINSNGYCYQHEFQKSNVPSLPIQKISGVQNLAVHGGLWIEQQKGQYVSVNVLLNTLIDRVIALELFKEQVMLTFPEVAEKVKLAEEAVVDDEDDADDDENKNHNMKKFQEKDDKSDGHK